MYIQSKGIQGHFFCEIIFFCGIKNESPVVSSLSKQKISLLL